ncbi:MAG: short-chain dehydrogenase [Verrucomicrobia bacterium]|nr:short-chain dehydrogenase [Verrucomicrobiota bacterium]
MTPDFSLAGHAALVTGSSQGIGLAIARGIHEAGGRVVLHGKAGAAPDFPVATPCLVADLLEAGAGARLVGEAFRIFPALDLLVCNAGSFFDQPFLEIARENWDRTLQLNVSANYFLAQAFARELVARQRPGAIVTTCSTNGFLPEENSTAYDTSKGALVMMTRTLAQALAPHAIRVNGIAPGLIRTPLSAGAISPDKIAHYERKILQGRLGEPEDCAGAVVFLLSPAAAYVTGQIVTIDGGLTVGQIGRM